MRRKFIIIVLTICSSLVCSSVAGQDRINKNGIPLIRNYTAKEYQANEINWAIVQDNRGVLYIGNNDNGVLEYDGVTWNQIHVPNKSIIRSLAVDSLGIVYVGAVDEFGYIAPDKFGKMRYYSLSEKLDTAVKNFSHVWKTYATKNGVFYCCQKYIFHYKNVFSKPEIYKLDEGILFSFYVKDKIYSSNYYRGLQILNLVTKKQETAKGGEFFREKDIFAILPYDNENFLMACLPGGLVKYNINTGTVEILNKTPNQKLINYYIESGAVYSATEINEKYYALSTRTKGCIIFDKNLVIKYLLNKETGLQDETVTYLYFNTMSLNISKPLWIALYNGLSKTDVLTPINRLSKESGIEGIVKNIARYSKKLYIGTSVGLYYDSEDKIVPNFVRVKNINDIIFDLCKFKSEDNKEILLAGGGSDVYEIKGNYAIPLKTNLNNIYTIYQSSFYKNRIYLGLPKGVGFAYITYSNNRWSNPVFIESLKKYEIQDILEDNNGNLWLATSYDGIIKYDTKGKITVYDTLKGLSSLTSNLLFYDKGKLFVSSIFDGIFIYDHKTDKFYPTDYFGLIYKMNKLGVKSIHKIYDNTYLLITAIKNKYQLHKTIVDDKGCIALDTTSFKRLPTSSIESVYVDDDSVIWISSSEGVYSYDFKVKRDLNQKFYTLIRKVIDGKDSVLFYGTYYRKIKINDSTFNCVTLTQPFELKPIIEYDRNNLRFYYTAPYFEDEQEIYFSHKLEGFDKSWSKWTKENYVDYTNLLEGKYVFRVKAKNIYGIESEEAVFEFEILPPWYRTYLAYFGYFVGLILLIYVIVKLSTRRLQKLNEAYGKYLPGSFLKALEKRRVIDFKLGDMTEREMTIMFSDIRSYTNLSETMTPVENFKFQVRYLSQIGDMLNKNEGFAVQFYGDGVVAMFPGDTDNAVQASIDMHNKISEYNEERIKKNRQPLKIGVGMHTGKVVMGIRGDKRRWEGGIVGDSVNLASRVEGLTKMYGASTCISEDTYRKLKNPSKFNIRFLGKVKVKGKEQPVGIYEVIDGLPEEEFNLKKKTLNDFDAAVRLYYEKEFELSKKYFEKVIQINPQDIAAKHYLELIEEILKEGLPENWDGVEKLDKK